jgi:HSP20 family protein
MLYTPTGRLGWDPFAEMRRMQTAMNRLLADFDTRPAPVTYPPVNVWVGDDSAVVTAELPGVAENDIDLSVREDTLTIQGRREPAVDPEKTAWHRRERAYGRFSRVVDLPFRIDPDKVQARFTNGVLEVEMHRPEADRPKRIQITNS